MYLVHNQRIFEDLFPSNDPYRCEQTLVKVIVDIFVPRKSLYAVRASRARRVPQSKVEQPL